MIQPYPEPEWTFRVFDVSALGVDFRNAGRFNVSQCGCPCNGKYCEGQEGLKERLQSMVQGFFRRLFIIGNQYVDPEPDPYH